MSKTQSRLNSPKSLTISLSKSLTLLLLSGLVAISGCSVLDKDEPEPKYIHITNFSLETPSNNTQGSNTHDIRDVWVDAQGLDVGVFEVPATFPIILNSDTNTFIPILLQAGIKNNGRANNRIRYPFYKILTDTINRSSGVMDTIRPIVKYVDNLKFPWLEDLEDRTISLETSGADVSIDTILLTNDSAEVFEYGPKNQYSAVVDMGVGEQYFEASTIPTFDFPRGRPVYLEMNYKSDVAVQIGLSAFEGMSLRAQVPVLLLFPTGGEWKKVYISLGEDANNADYTGMDFKVFFAARNSGEIDNPKIFLDNLKILHL